MFYSQNPKLINCIIMSKMLIIYKRRMLIYTEACLYMPSKECVVQHYDVLYDNEKISHKNAKIT